MYLLRNRRLLVYFRFEELCWFPGEELDGVVASIWGKRAVKVQSTWINGEIELEYENNFLGLAGGRQV